LIDYWYKQKKTTEYIIEELRKCFSVEVLYREYLALRIQEHHYSPILGAAAMFISPIL
jgi:hypothetical protein